MSSSTSDTHLGLDVTAYIQRRPGHKSSIVTGGYLSRGVCASVLVKKGRKDWLLYTFVIQYRITDRVIGSYSRNTGVAAGETIHVCPRNVVSSWQCVVRVSQGVCLTVSLPATTSGVNQNIFNQTKTLCITDEDTLVYSELISLVVNVF